MVSTASGQVKVYERCAAFTTRQRAVNGPPTIVPFS